MSTENEATNGQIEEKPVESTTTRRTPRRPAKASTEEKGGIVKASAEQGEIFILDDMTRIVATDTLPNHRPIALSDFQIVGSLNMAGSRPIMADAIQVFTTDLLPGHRPVAVSTLPISDLNFLPGNRPIAPNDVVDPPAPVLMGYLD